METKAPKNKLLFYLDIYWTMFKIGITTFGGGYAMVAIIDKELGDKKQWLEKEELLNYIAISQITPGVIAVNVSTFVGRKRGGILGAVLATLGVVSPSILIILCIAALLTSFADDPFVRHAFAGIRVCVCVLIINATIGFIKKTVIDVLSLLIFLCVFVLAAFTRIETVYIILAVLAVGILFTLLAGEKKSAAAGSGEKVKSQSGQIEPQESAGKKSADEQNKKGGRS